MKKLYPLILCLLLSIPAWSQNVIYPWLPENGNKLKDFVPADWNIIQTATGDLNGDSLPDIAAVIEQKFPGRETFGSDTAQQPIYAHPRILLILLQNASGSWKYKLSVQNNVFILRVGEGSLTQDPFQKLAVNNEGLHLAFMGGSGSKWALTYTFKYKREQWILADATEMIARPDFGTSDYWQFDFESRKFRHGTAGNPETINSAPWKKLKVKKPPTLSSFYRPWTWEIMSGLYL